MRKKRVLTKKAIEKYVNCPACCPLCGNEKEFVTGQCDQFFDRVNRLVYCMYCHKWWIEEYKLVNISQ